jgi:hypothetical protein
MNTPEKSSHALVATDASKFHHCQRLQRQLPPPQPVRNKPVARNAEVGMKPTTQT